MIVSIKKLRHLFVWVLLHKVRHFLGMCPFALPGDTRKVRNNVATPFLLTAALWVWGNWPPRSGTLFQLSSPCVAWTHQGFLSQSFPDLLFPLLEHCLPTVHFVIRVSAQALSPEGPPWLLQQSLSLPNPLLPSKPFIFSLITAMTFQCPFTIVIYYCSHRRYPEDKDLVSVFITTG